MIRHLLSTRDLSRSSAIALLDTAEDMAALGARENKKLPALRGKTIVNLFYEDSTRTRISFEVAQKRLSADVINFSAKGSSVGKFSKGGKQRRRQPWPPGNISTTRG
jgi:aspartate carbamoyltransferase catalytic subunit